MVWGIVAELSTKIEDGDYKAALDLGIYLEGNCPNNPTHDEIDSEEYIAPPEYVEALKWYIIADYASENNSIVAFVRWVELENTKMDIESGELSHSLAKNWFYETAEQGKKWPQYWLGNLYETGRMVEQDDQKALYWYTKAAEQGIADAQLKLGYWYQGDNDEEAFKWF